MNTYTFASLPHHQTHHLPLSAAKKLATGAAGRRSRTNDDQKAWRLEASAIGARDFDLDLDHLKLAVNTRFRSRSRRSSLPENLFAVFIPALSCHLSIDPLPEPDAFGLPPRIRQRPRHTSAQRCAA
jgi:hypothetical protein